MTAADTLRAAAGLKPAAVYLHGFHNTEYGQEHCDPDDNPHGWCVYTRHENDGTSHIDLSDEQDFPDRASALTEAENRATRHGVEVREY